MGIREILDHFEEIGYKDMVLHEVVTQLAGLGPNIPVFAIDHEDGGNVHKFVTGFTIDNDGKQPILLIHVSEQPEEQRTIEEFQNHDEKVAEKREKAMDMQRKSDAANKL